MLRIHCCNIRWSWHTIAKASTATLLMLLLHLSPIATHPAAAAWGKRRVREETTAIVKSGKLSEVAPPSVIQELRQAFDDNEPQVSILTPRANEVLANDTVSIQLQVKDLPIFKDKTFDLGPHLHVFLDNQPYQAVYDLSKPLILAEVSPGTHTLRAFAARPWHESFKNAGAYAETTFHVFTQTGDNTPDLNLPLLTYSRPQASYGAEPIMLDFYLTNAPLHLVAREDKQDDVADWRIRCTVNGDSFVLDQWQPIYLKGFKPGKNWVQLEFLDENGDPVQNEFNNIARLINYEPGGKDSLAKLMRGDLSATAARSMVDRDYKPPVPAPTPSPSSIALPTPIPSPSPTPTPVPAMPLVKATPAPTPSPDASKELQPSIAHPSPELTEIKPEPSAASFPVIAVPAADVESPADVELPNAIEPPVAAPPARKVEPREIQLQPQAKPTNPVKDFFKRFRSEAKLVKPAPSASPTPTVTEPQPVSPVEIVPQFEQERPAPVAVPKAVKPSITPEPIRSPESIDPETANSVDPVDLNP